MSFGSFEENSLQKRRTANFERNPQKLCASLDFFLEKTNTRKLVFRDDIYKLHGVTEYKAPAFREMEGLLRLFQYCYTSIKGG